VLRFVYRSINYLLPYSFNLKGGNNYLLVNHELINIMSPIGSFVIVDK
jgi:hypothetical protein